MWFTETPWPPIYICIGLFVLFFAYGVGTGRGKGAVLGVCCLLACPFIYAVETMVVSEGERVELSVLEFAKDVQNADVDTALLKIDAEASVIRGLVSTGLQKFKVNGTVRITDLAVTIDPNGTEAVAHFRANATVGHAKQGETAGQRFPSRWNFHFKKQENEWKIAEIERLSPVSGKTMPVLAPRIQ